LKKKISVACFTLAVATTVIFFTKVVISLTYLPLPGAKEPVVFYSNHLNHSLRRLVLKSLQTAKDSIDLHTYALTDEAVLSKLLEKSPSLQSLHILSDDKTMVKTLKPLQETLHWEGMKSSGLMHEKILTIDNSLIFLGTANMTYESLCMHDNLVIGFYNPPLARYLQEYTEARRHNPKRKNRFPATFTLDEQALQLWMLPYQGEAPLENLVDLCNKAHHSLSLAIFTLTHPRLIEAMIQAHQRGIQVKVFLDHTSAHGASSAAVKALTQARVPLYFSEGLQLLHHKMLFVDDKVFVLGSANWTKSAFKKNHDFYLVLSPLKASQSKTLRRVFHHIEHRASLQKMS